MPNLKISDLVAAHAAFYGDDLKVANELRAKAKMTKTDQKKLDAANEAISAKSWVCFKNKTGTTKKGDSGVFKQEIAVWEGPEMKSQLELDFQLEAAPSRFFPEPFDLKAGDQQSSMSISFRRLEDSDMALTSFTDKNRKTVMERNNASVDFMELLNNEVMKFLKMYVVPPANAEDPDQWREDQGEAAAKLCKKVNFDIEKFVTDSSTKLITIFKTRSKKGPLVHPCFSVTLPVLSDKYDKSVSSSVGLVGKTYGNGKPINGAVFRSYDPRGPGYKKNPDKALKKAKKQAKALNALGHNLKPSKSASKPVGYPVTVACADRDEVRSIPAFPKNSSYSIKVDDKKVKWHSRLPNPDEVAESIGVFSLITMPMKLEGLVVSNFGLSTKFWHTTCTIKLQQQNEINFGGDGLEDDDDLEDEDDEESEESEDEESEEEDDEEDLEDDEEKAASDDEDDEDDAINSDDDE